MKFLLIAIGLGIVFASPSYHNAPRGRKWVDVVIRNVASGVFATVQEDGKVLGKEFNAGDPYQIWTIDETLTENAEYQGRFTIMNNLVKYNDLSGPPSNPDNYPKPWAIKDIGDKKFELRVRGRWCLETRNLGQQFTIDDCEIEFDAPYQHWMLEPANRYY